MLTNFRMDLSVIITSYNTKEITLRCLSELDEVCGLSKELSIEVVVVDNASIDGSYEALQKIQMVNAKYQVIQNRENVGFSRGNNIGFHQTQGKYILFLNSDAMMKSTINRHVNLTELIYYLKGNSNIGALTVKVELTNGTIDPASHRGFPTPWRSLCYFAGIEKLIHNFNFSSIKLKNHLGGYHLLGEDKNTIHEIDACTAAFLLCPADLIRELDGFDEQFFMYGEDLDLCYRIKQKGLKIIWYPKYSVTHLKYKSGLAAGDKKTQRSIRWYFHDSMEKFYTKHYKANYPFCINWLILTIIKMMGLKSKYEQRN